MCGLGETAQFRKQRVSSVERFSSKFEQFSSDRYRYLDINVYFETALKLVNWPTNCHGMIASLHRDAKAHMRAVSRNACPVAEVCLESRKYHARANFT